MCSCLFLILLISCYPVAASLLAEVANAGMAVFVADITSLSGLGSDESTALLSVCSLVRWCGHQFIFPSLHNVVSGNSFTLWVVISVVVTVTVNTPRNPDNRLKQFAYHDRHKLRRHDTHSTHTSLRSPDGATTSYSGNAYFLTTEYSQFFAYLIGIRARTVSPLVICFWRSLGMF